MRRKKLVLFLCVMICMMAMVIPSFARASDQIEYHSVDVMSNNGQIYVDFSVDGTGSMQKIGCESIYIYESSSGRLVESLDENDTGMSRWNASKFSNVVSADCEVGTSYRVEVTIFAEDSAGRDTRSQTFYVTGQA